MSDGPTRQEAARDKLERAAMRFSVVGRRPATDENRPKFQRATAALHSAAMDYASAVSKRQET